jgi:predicted transcriptional regulator
MDDRTAQLLEALTAANGRLLFELLREGGRREVDVIAAADEPAQPTGNRHLHKLRAVGLIRQEEGKPHAPGRMWDVAHPAETEELFEALFALADAIEHADRERRMQARKALRLSRAQRLGIREA